MRNTIDVSKLDLNETIVSIRRVAVSYTHLSVESALLHLGVNLHLDIRQERKRKILTNIS